MNTALLEALSAARAAGRPVVLATRLPIGRADPAARRRHPGAGGGGRQGARRGSQRHGAIDGEAYFLHVYNPPLRLVVVGAVHIAQALVPMAASLGTAIIVVDPRRSFATSERFPGVTISTEWPDDAMEALRPDFADRGGHPDA